MVAKESSAVPFYFGKIGLLPQEEMLEVGKKRQSLVIGVPREKDRYESRVSLTPEAVELLVNNGHKVVIETGAGKAANYNDTDYSENGGMIVPNPSDVFSCDIILKIAPPIEEEIQLMPGNQVVISSLHLSRQSESTLRMLMEKRITAIAHETIKDQYNQYPVMRSMSEIAGTTAVLIAAEYLSNVNGGKGVLLGGITGITPTEVIIIGAGTAGEFAARAALGLGAFVKIIDNSIHKLNRLQNNLGQRLHTSVFHPKVVEKALRSADIVIGAVHLLDRGPRFFVTEEQVMEMKRGSVIVDIAIDQGGCIETSECRDHGNPVFEKHGIIHYCVPNIPSRVARTASIALSNVFLPIIIRLGEAGGIKAMLKDDTGLRQGVYMYNGILTNNLIGNYFGISSKDLDLLMAAF
jgi:alanine dehydrogenase